MLLDPRWASLYNYINMDSEDESDFTPSWRGVPGTIIVINIFRHSKYDSFTPAHEATCRSIKQYLRSANSQYIAVCICGIEEPNASILDSKSLVEVMPLSSPTIDGYKKLKNLDISSFVEAKQFILSDVLWHCSKMFTNCKKQLSSKSIILLTPLQEAPVDTDKSPTIKRVEDLVDSNIEIRLLNISTGEFSVNPYYEKFLAKANKGLQFVIPKPIQDPLQIEKLIHQVSHRNLAVAKLNFEIGGGMEIGVSIYKLMKTGQNYHKTANLDRDSNAVLTSVTKTTKVNVEAEDMDTDSPEHVPLLKSERLYYSEFGSERVEFTEAEMKAMKNPFGPPILRLLGFKPSIIICKEKWYTKPPYFLFPNESTVEGSTTAFRALHKACMDMSVVAICVLCTRVNAKPALVALCPCSKPLNMEVDIGFDVVQLPFMENVRNLNLNEANNEMVVQQKQKNLMKEIVNKTKFDFQSDMFENPKLESEFKAIEAIALDEDDLDPFVDTTKPSSSRFSDLGEDLFEELFGPFGTVPVKRAATNTSETSNKKIKVEIDEELLRKRVDEKKLHMYTVAQLRDILKSKDIEDLPALTGIKKNELVDLVYKYF